MDEMEQLAFKNRFVRQLVQDLDNFEASDATPQVISGPDNLILLQVSLEEWIQLTSSVFTGADICYPDKSDTVRWILYRAVEQPMDLCALIAQCIENSPETRAAIRDLVLTDPEINQHINDLAFEQAMSLSERGENILKPEACDPGFLFNQASVLVQLLHDLSEDIFEAIEVGTNQAERAQLLASGIPGVGLAPFDEIIGLADQLVEEIAEDYAGAYDEGLFDDIRCKIFCAIKDDCELSLDKVIGVYEELFSDAIPSDPLSAFLAVITYLSNGDLPTDAPVYAMHLLVLTAMRMSSEVLGIDFTRLALRVIAAGDESDNDWGILCEDCPPPPVGGLDIVAYEAWAPYVTWTFESMDGTDEWWRVRLLAGSPSGSFTGLSANEIDFYIMEEQITEGSFTNVREYNTGAVQTTAPFHDDILITVYFAAFGDVWPAEMRVRLRPVP